MVIFEFTICTLKMAETLKEVDLDDLELGGVPVAEAIDDDEIMRALEMYRIIKREEDEEIEIKLKRARMNLSKLEKANNAQKKQKRTEEIQAEYAAIIQSLPQDEQSTLQAAQSTSQAAQSTPPAAQSTPPVAQSTPQAAKTLTLNHIIFLVLYSFCIIIPLSLIFSYFGFGIYALITDRDIDGGKHLWKVVLFIYTTLPPIVFIQFKVIRSLATKSKIENTVCCFLFIIFLVELFSDIILYDALATTDHFGNGIRRTNLWQYGRFQCMIYSSIIFAVFFSCLKQNS